MAKQNDKGDIIFVHTSVNCFCLRTEGAVLHTESCLSGALPFLLKSAVKHRQQDGAAL